LEERRLGNVVSEYPRPFFSNEFGPDSFVIQSGEEKLLRYTVTTKGIKETEIPISDLAKTEDIPQAEITFPFRGEKRSVPGQWLVSAALTSTRAVSLERDVSQLGQSDLTTPHVVRLMIFDWEKQTIMEEIPGMEYLTASSGCAPQVLKVNDGGLFLIYTSTYTGEYVVIDAR
jgi:hypothetical protein